MTDAAPTTAPPGDRHLVSHVFNLVAMALGGIGLAWMLHDLGLAVLTDAVEGVGGWFFVILILDLAGLCCDAAALQAFMRPEARMVSYARVLGAQASGRAINVLTPTGALGEPTKLAMLVTHAPRDRVLSSLVLLNLSQFYLSVLGIVLGTPIVFLLVGLPAALEVPVAIAFGVLIPLVVALGVIVQRGALSTIVATLRGLRAIPSERSKAWQARVATVDLHIRELQANRSHGTWKGFVWVGLSRVVQWTSTLLLLSTAGVAIQPALIVGVLSLGVLIQWISQIVPMGLGLADGGNYALYDLTGASGAHGVVITLLNRARSIAIAILGLGAMLVLHTLDRLALARMQRRLEGLRDKAEGQSS